MFISITAVDGTVSAAIIGVDRHQLEHEAGDNDQILCHEPMFGKDEASYDTGEAVISAIARTTGDEEGIGSALERLVEQAFMLGLAHGIKTERERIVSRLTDD